MSYSDVDVLRRYGCTEKEAQNHLSRGTTVYRDLERHFNAYMEEWGIEEDGQEVYRNMIEGGKPVDDWEVVEIDGVKYYIQFCL